MPEMENEIIEQTNDADITKENEPATQELDPKTLIAQKEHFRAKFEKEKLEREKLEEQLKSRQTTNTEAKSSISEDRLEAIEFAVRHPEIEAKISTEVLEIARAKGIKPEEALELPYFKTYIEKMAEEKATSSGMPNNGRSPIFKTDKPLSEMTAEERKRDWNNAIKKIL